MKISRQSAVGSRNWFYSLLFTLYSLLFTPYYLYAVSDTELFSNGCEFYKKGNYEKALEQFTLLEKKYQDTNLFYNLGNTYFRLGKIGFARVYYEKAQKITPLDDDVNFNIKFLANMINDPDYEQSLISRLDINTMRLLFAISLLVFTVIVSVKFINPQKRLFWGFVLSFIFFAFFSTLYLLKYRSQNQKYAVVVNNTEVRSGPDTNFKVNFTLVEGKKVMILGFSGDWVEVGVKSMGVSGWLEKKYIEII